MTTIRQVVVLDNHVPAPDGDQVVAIVGFDGSGITSAGQGCSRSLLQVV